MPLKGKLPNKKYCLPTHYYMNIGITECLWIAQSAGAVEYTDCTSAEG